MTINTSTVSISLQDSVELSTALQNYDHAITLVCQIEYLSTLVLGDISYALVHLVLGVSWSKSSTCWLLRCITEFLKCHTLAFLNLESSFFVLCSLVKSHLENFQFLGTKFYFKVLEMCHLPFSKKAMSSKIHSLWHHVVFCGERASKQKINSTYLFTLKNYMLTVWDLSLKCITATS